jgi:hypothetical protein
MTADLRGKAWGALRSHGLALAVSAALGVVCVRAIFEQAGGPAAPLDDTFIHFQYAKHLAEGRFFSYVAGEGYSSGATSLLWPLVLAPFYKLGLRDLTLLWAAWILGTIAHAGVAVEAYRITRRLAGESAAIGSAAMCLSFGAFAWFAWSGMETMALAWILLRTARVAAAACDPERGRAPPSPREILILGLLAPLVRPEGALASLIAAAALLRVLSAEKPARRALAVVPLLGPAIVPLLNRLCTGHAASTTAQVKWLIGNPYYSLSTVLAVFAQNARVLVSNLMNGGDWTVIFLPEHSNVPILLGFVLLPISGMRRKVPHHAIFVALIALGSLAPCTYGSFLWNRIRYVWPFSPAWFVLACCFAREAGDLVRLLRPRLTAVTPLLAGGFAAALALRLPFAIHDLGQSAAAVLKQQVTLGRWASATLPADARVGVNDTGAIAYVSERKTFDVVGLTTEGEARYWVAGAGSRFEHYERLPRERLPTHFIVYPQWMACPPVLGKMLTEATVTEQSILGGTTMVAYEARWDLLGSGALPATPPKGLTLLDEVDVADLESESAHAYAIWDGWDQDDVVGVHGDPHVIADGGRLRRARDRFLVKLPSGKPARLVMRLTSEAPLELAVLVDEREIGAAAIPADFGWIEREIELPAGSADRAYVTVAVRGTRHRFGAFHYWIYAP